MSHALAAHRGLTFVSHKFGRRHLIRVGVGFLALATLFTAFSLIYFVTLRGHVYPGVKLGSLDLGGLEFSRAEAQINELLAGYNQTPMILRQGNKVWQPTLAELGLSLDSVGTMQNIKQVGRGDGLRDMFAATAYAISRGDTVLPELIVQGDTLDAYLAGLQKTVNQPTIQPTISYSNGQLAYQPGEQGVSLDAETLKAIVLGRVLRLAEVDVSLPMEPAAVPAETYQVGRLQNQIQNLISPGLDLTVSDLTFRIEPSELASWLTVYNSAEANSDSFELALNESAVSRSLERIAEAAAVTPSPFIAYAAETAMTRPPAAGQDGRVVDYAATVQRIKTDWLTHGRNQVELATIVIDRPVEILTATAPKDQGKVILVDLSKQTAFAFEDGKLKYAALTSTGKWPRVTKTGEFKVYAKVAKQKMSGPGYYLPGVPWVMFYNGDYSLHGTYWHDNFGHPMSHGCTNLSKADAEWFFNWAERGTPVVIVGETPR